MGMSANVRWLGVGIAVLVTGCLTDEGGVLRPTRLEKVAAGDGQTGLAGAGLPMPLAVVARTGDGTGAVRVPIAWSMTGGPPGAVLTDSLTLTDGTGRAEVRLVLGKAVGSYTIRAAFGGAHASAVTFTAAAVPAPSLSAVSPSSFSSGDTLTLTGADLSTATRFEVAGFEVPVVPGTLTGTTVRVIAPQCLAPGTVEIRALEAGARSDPVTGLFAPANAALTLTVGEVAVIPAVAVEVGGCAAIPPPGAGGAEYLIAVQSATARAGTLAGYRLRSGPPVPVVAPPAVVKPALPLPVRFHDFLRNQERQFPRLRPAPAAPEVSPLATAPVRVGQRRDFAVCADINCQAAEDFAHITAEARFVGQHAAIYQDIDAPPGGFADADFQSLGDVFDQELYDLDTRAFGAESDIDGNGLVIILMTPVVNSLTPTAQCKTAFVTGFFFATDLDPAFINDPRSNQGEVFYSFVPDPGGTVTCDHSLDRVRRGVPVTFVHEFQHMISYYQHVLVRGGSDTEELWLNEAMSHLAEELAARRFLAQGDSTRFTRFAIGDLINAYDYFRDPGGTFLLATQGGGSLQERGAGWLFLRWLLDQHGENLTRQLAETPLRGTANVEAATGRTMTQLLPEWFLANYVSDLLPDSIRPSPLTYTSWRFRTTYSSLHDQAKDLFPLAFPLVPDTIRTTVGFDRSGVLRAGSGDYFLLVMNPGDPGASLAFTGPGGEPLGSETDPRLEVVRLR